MKDIAQILTDYCVENDYWFLKDTPSGGNQAVDQFLHSEQDYALFLNIIETGSIVTNDDNGRKIAVSRTVEIYLYQKDVKEDKGYNYYPLLADLLERQVETYRYLLKNLDITSASYETGVDQSDATLALVKLTINFDETLVNC